MKKYVTFVKDEEESRQVQGALFILGLEWCTNDRAIHKCKGLLFVDKNGKMFTRRVSEMFNRDFDSEVDEMRSELLNYDFLEAQEIILDPSIIECDKPATEKTHCIDGKDFSESTIKAALQEHVK